MMPTGGHPAPAALASGGPRVGHRSTRAWPRPTRWR